MTKGKVNTSDKAEVTNSEKLQYEKRSLGVALLIIATSQLMLALDDTIANIALPRIQHDLGVPTLMLPWIVNAYILAFGSLLLFGGQLGDVYGRRRILRWGMSLFTLGSLSCGLAPNTEFLIGSRCLQGVGAALAAPSALGLIAVIFPVGKDRNSAIATYGAMSALGIVGGVLLGGVLTDFFTWRSVFLINVPIGITILFFSGKLAEGDVQRIPLDIVGAIGAVGAMFSLTFGITQATENGWTSVPAVGSFVVALALGSFFVWNQASRSQPMMPLELFKNRNRSGSYVSMIFVGMGLMGTFYLVALYMQQVWLFSPLRTGLAALPFSIGIITASILSSKLIEKLPPRMVAVPGLLIAAIGMGWLSSLQVTSTYTWHVMPALFLTSFGLGMAAVTLTLTAVRGISEERAGIASALLNASQQSGAALGLALFTAIAAISSQSLLLDATMAVGRAATKGDAEIIAVNEALAHGYAVAFGYGAVALLLAMLIVGLSVNTQQTQTGKK